MDYLRGDATEDSDLDIIVRFDPGRSLLDHGGLLMDLRELLGVNIKRFLTPLFLLVPSPQPNHPWPAGDTASIG